MRACLWRFHYIIRGGLCNFGVSIHLKPFEQALSRGASLSKFCNLRSTIYLSINLSLWIKSHLVAS